MLSMEKRLTDRRIKWQRLHLSQWYGQPDKVLEVTTGQAIWYKSGEPAVPLRWVLIRDPEGQADPVLLGSTDRTLSVQQLITFFVSRWQVEVTFAEVRRHLGVETQRQWSDLAIERTTPVLMALFSIVCLMGKRLDEQQRLQPNITAWYAKRALTFSDVLAAVRKRIWTFNHFSTSAETTEVEKYSYQIRYLWQVLINAVA